MFKVKESKVVVDKFLELIAFILCSKNIAAASDLHL